MNFTPLDQAYQVHHGNPNMYVSNQVQNVNPKCIFCSSQNSIALMEKHDGGALRQCGNPSCRKHFNAVQSNNYQFTNNNTHIMPKQQQMPLQQMPLQQPQQMPLQEQRQPNPYLPSEPNFITRYTTNSNQKF
jgi:hypothetical protein